MHVEKLPLCTFPWTDDSFSEECAKKAGCAGKPTAYLPSCLGLAWMVKLPKTREKRIVGICWQQRVAMLKRKVPHGVEGATATCSKCVVLLCPRKRKQTVLALLNPRKRRESGCLIKYFSTTGIRTRLACEAPGACSETTAKL